MTGKEDEIAAVHPSVKGVRDAQSSGAALVSFNAPAFCSYGREQNYNAPVGKYAAFAYTAALNHLLADSDHVQHIGDTTVVCWAEGADDAYPGFFSAVIGGGTYGGLSDNDLRAALKRLANGLPCDDLGVDPNRPFYILGLAPNAARLSVRFFLRDSFGKLMENVNAHYERMEIVRIVLPACLYCSRSGTVLGKANSFGKPCNARHSDGVMLRIPNLSFIIGTLS